MLKDLKKVKGLASFSSKLNKIKLKKTSKQLFFYIWDHEKMGLHDDFSWFLNTTNILAFQYPRMCGDFGYIYDQIFQ